MCMRSMAQRSGHTVWKSEVLKEFQHEYLISIYRNSVEIPKMAPKKKAQKPTAEDSEPEHLEQQIPAMAPKKRAQKRTAEDSVPELGTPKGPRLAYAIGEGKRSGEDPEGGGGGEDPEGGGSGSAGSSAETDRRPVDHRAENERSAVEKARSAAEKETRAVELLQKKKESLQKTQEMLRRKLRERRALNDDSDEDNRNWERVEARWNDEAQEAQERWSSAMEAGQMSPVTDGEESWPILQDLLFAGRGG